MPQVDAGTIVHGYRVERLLGRGGMGAVHLAQHVETSQIIALKSMSDEAAERPEFRKRFRREARAAMAVHHPNVVRVHEIFEFDGSLFIAMEYLEGESLEARLVREERIPLGAMARIAIRITSAVGTAHAMGIVHRDLKPENIFLVGDPAAPHVKILDFGIAKLTATEGDAAQTSALTSTGALMGTPYYMSPEQAFGEKKIDQRSDIWSLGIILYRALSGVLPTQAHGFGEVFRLVVQGKFEPLERLVPELPADVCALVSSMLQKQADLRPWDLRECHEVLMRHASTREEVTSFGMAVSPIWDEKSTETEAPSPTSLDAARDSLATTPGGSKPLLRRPMTPPAGGGTLALPFAATPAVSADDGAATLLYRPEREKTPASSLLPADAPRAAASGSRVSLVVGVVLLVALTLVGVLVAR